MKKKIIILIFLSLVFSFILFPLKVKAQNTGGCIIYDSGTYPATYSFTNEVDGTSNTGITGIYQVDITDTNGIVIIHPLNDGHRKVIKASGNGDNGAHVDFLFGTYLEVGTIYLEWWIKYIDNGQGFFRFWGHNQDWSAILYFYFNSANNRLYFAYGNGIGGTTWVFVSTFPDRWYHFRFKIDTITDKQSVWIDDVAIFIDQNFDKDRLATSYFRNYFRLDAGGGINALEVYIDAIGYSFDSNYIVGSNRYPLSINQGAYQPMLAFFILIILMSLMFFLYMKVRKPELLILVVFLFSLIIGIGALMNCGIPFTPYLQIFFILFQLSIFILASLNYYEKQKKKRY